MKAEHILLLVLLVAVLAFIYIIDKAVKKGQHIVISIPPLSVEINKLF